MDSSDHVLSEFIAWLYKGNVMVFVVVVVVVVVVAVFTLTFSLSVRLSPSLPLKGLSDGVHEDNLLLYSL